MSNSTSRLALFVVTSIALVAFAGNSILCRLALAGGLIDPGSFTVVRIYAGALTLLAIVFCSRQRGQLKNAGSWTAGCCLFVYAAAFSFAYVNLPAATGALILFTFVQFSMIGLSWLNHQRLNRIQWTGTFIAFGGFIYLLMPGSVALAIVPSILMISAGIAWGLYSFLGGQSSHPLADTTTNFLRAALICLLLLPFYANNLKLSWEGAWLAIISGALTSGMGYVIWYKALPLLSANIASISQLTVPILTAIGGRILLDESLSTQFVVASAIVLSGIFIVIFFRPNKRPA